MKKLLLFFIAATLISCGGKDDDEAGRTTDPLIGTWYREFDEATNATLVYNSNGTWIANTEEEEGETGTITGGWNNNGSDFDAVRQIYTFTYDDGSDDLTFTIEFNPDFSSFTIEDDQTWSRQ